MIFDKFVLLPIIAATAIIAVMVFAVLGTLQYNDELQVIGDYPCDDLLTEIKKENSKNKTIFLVDTWIEKECWK